MAGELALCSLQRLWHATPGIRCVASGLCRGCLPAFCLPCGAADRMRLRACHHVACLLLPRPCAQILATYWELPVSSTHTVVGAVVGMTVVAAGPDAVNWSEKTGSFPFLGVRCVCGCSCSSCGC